MSTKPQHRPWRTLAAIFIVVAGLAVWAFWPGQEHTPRLGLDLRGGTQVVLLAQSVTSGGSITDEQLSQTVEIIRQRVNGLGVAEAEVTTQGSGGNAAVVVSVPGVSSEQLAAQLSQTALLDFRAVVMEDYGSPQASAEAAGEPQVGTDELNRQLQEQLQSSQDESSKKSDKKSSKGQSAPLTPAKKKPTPTPASPTAPGSPDAGSMSPPIQMDSNNAALQSAFQALDCSKPENYRGGVPDDPAKWLVTCAKDGQAKYLLEPAFIRGTQVTNAQAGLPETGGGGWQVNLSFDSEGSDALADVSTKLSKLSPPQNQFAIVLDGLVQSSPYFQEPILGGQAQITGSFTAESAKTLANVLKYGALPVSLSIGEVTSLSPTLGTDQLQAALLAGAIGLALVVLYLFFYYRALGAVAVVSLAVAALMTYTVFVVLGRQIGMALTLAGVAGAIVAIGITADSFIVYFERIRDEIRDGRSLRVACEAGWTRARNTLLAADFVSLLGAAILYYLSIGNVRGFAFVLGLTTIIDVIVAFMFTRPVVALLARSELFQRGGAWTGLSPERLGVADLTGRSRGKRKRRNGGPTAVSDEAAPAGTAPDDGDQAGTVEADAVDVGSKGGR